MGKKLFVFLTLTTINLFAQTWETQNSRLTCNLNSICFIDTLNGWIVGDSATILKTIDGGKNWRKQPSPIEKVSFRKVQFISKNDGFILCQDGIFLSTNNAGVNWSISYIMPDSSGYSFDDLCFIDENNGWIPGRKEGRNYGIGLIMHTTNGGINWEKQLEILSYVQTDAKFFSSVVMKNKNVGWALASDYFDNFSSAYIYETNTGGLNWQNIGQMIYPNWKLSIAKEDTLWSGGGPLLISKDSGYTWDKPLSEFYYSRVISPESGLRGWIFNYDPFANTKKIFRTTNGGSSWLEELNLDEFVINDMTNVSGILWIVGSNGLIMREYPIVTSVTEREKTLQKEVYLGHNYPNPFNSGTIISFSLQNDDFVKLKIMDIIGREIKILIEKELKKGAYKVEFDARNISSGVYFYQLQTKNSVMTKKLILLK